MQPTFKEDISEEGLSLAKRARRRFVGAFALTLVALLTSLWVLDGKPNAQKAPEKPITVVADASAVLAAPIAAVEASVPAEAASVAASAPDTIQPLLSSASAATYARAAVPSAVAPLVQTVPKALRKDTTTHTPQKISVRKYRAKNQNADTQAKPAIPDKKAGIRSLKNKPVATAAQKNTKKQQIVKKVKRDVAPVKPKALRSSAESKKTKLAQKPKSAQATDKRKRLEPKPKKPQPLGVVRPSQQKSSAAPLKKPKPKTKDTP